MLKPGIEAFEVHWPTHAYVPGESQRHPEDAFDSIKAGVTTALSMQELARSSAFKHGLMYLHDGYYWEAHEVFEPVWLALPPGSDERTLVKGLIQVANAHLKYRMQRPKACQRLCDISRQLLSGLAPSTVMGVNRSDLLSTITDLETLL